MLSDEYLTIIAHLLVATVASLVRTAKDPSVKAHAGSLRAAPVGHRDGTARPVGASGRDSGADTTAARGDRR